MPQLASDILQTKVKRCLDSCFLAQKFCLQPTLRKSSGMVKHYSQPEILQANSLADYILHFNLASRCHVNDGLRFYIANFKILIIVVSIIHPLSALTGQSLSFLPAGGSAR
jgi:hypothetical protein